MGWFIHHHVYYMRSKDFVAFLALMHLLCMVLTGYGVLRHCSDLYEIQNNIWAVCVAAVSFLCNICATKATDAFFKWFLPFTLVFSLTSFMTLSAYHGIVMVLMVHLPLVSFVLTGMPCCVIVIICAAGLGLGLLFHTALISSLYSDYHGHISLSFMQNVTSWLRHPRARGFNIIILDCYIVAVQVIAGVLCYQRFRKLGSLIGIYRARPARYLGSFDAIRSLEEAFLPSQSQCDLIQANMMRRSSAPVHYASPCTIDSEDESDRILEQITNSSSPKSPSRFPLEPIEPYRFKNMSITTERIVPGITETALSPHSTSDGEMDQSKKHHKRKPVGGYLSSLLPSATVDDYMSNPNTESSHATGRSRSIDSGYSTPPKGRKVNWLSVGTIHTRDHSVPRLEVYSVEGDKLDSSDIGSTRLTERSSIHHLSPVGSRSHESAFSRPATQEHCVNRRDRATSTSARFLDTWRASCDSEESFVRLSSHVQKDLPTSAKILLNTGTPAFSMEKFGIESAGLRIGSFEGGGFMPHHDYMVMGSGGRIGSHARMFGSNGLSDSGRIINSGRSSSESNAGEGLPSTGTMSVIRRVIPLCGIRLVMYIGRLWDQICLAQDMGNHTWSKHVNIPETNFLGIFAHTRVESWYVSWMQEFNLHLYGSTVMETLMIIAMGLLSDALVLVRMYSTLEEGETAARVFSESRIVIMALRYGLYPISVALVLCHLMFKPGKKDILFYYRSLVAVCLLNMGLTFADMWSCLDIFTTGYALQNSLYMCSMLTSTTLLLFTRIPVLLCLYLVCFILYGVLLLFSGYGLGHSVLELLCQLIVAAGCLFFCARPIDSNRRKLFCSYTLPYLLYMESMRI